MVDWSSCGALLVGWLVVDRCGGGYPARGHAFPCTLVDDSARDHHDPCRPDGVISPDRAHAGSVPFACTAAARLMCIDMDIGMYVS